MEELVAEVHSRFAPKFRQRITPQDVEAVVRELDLSDQRASRRASRLRLRRLLFTGTKSLHGCREPIQYDQTWEPGVNVLLISDNEVGKSTVMQTIRTALTGDDSHYDVDVSTWITDVWLVFFLDEGQYTILLSRRDGVVRAVLVLGEDLRPIEDVAETSSTLINSEGAASVKSDLQQFFFNRLGLMELSWNHTNPAAHGVGSERSTSWRTYFQALLIPAGGEGYLLLPDVQHNYGNQEGLIFTAFLGLRLADPINRLGVEASRTRAQEQTSRTEVQGAQDELVRWQSELHGVQRRIADLKAAIRARSEEVLQGDPTSRALATHDALSARGIEKQQIEMQKDALDTRVRQARARARQLREAVALRLHFTGLEVNLCPNCDAVVEPAAVTHERGTHHCRLCGKPARGATDEDVVIMEAEAQAAQKQASEIEHARAALTAHLNTLTSEIEALAAEARASRQAAISDLSDATPSLEEQTELDSLHEEVGRLRAHVAIAQARVDTCTTDDESAEVRHRVVEKLREVLEKEANRRNEQLLLNLSSYTQETALRIGAESITDVACSPLGRVTLKKHGERVSFARIQNVGERLRVKLAFFLAMMRLGSEPGLGRHPGFPMVDSPGAAEMVPEDFENLASVFRQIDSAAADVQIICFTARPEFAAATIPEKVYGPQNGRFAF